MLEDYGRVCNAEGRLLAEDLLVVQTNQEHGVIARRDGARLDPERYRVGTLLRVLPNHACATGAQHAAYHIVNSRETSIEAVWSRFSGW